MKCPKCEEETLKKIELKGRDEIVLLCEFCDTYWEEGESVSQSTGKPFKDLTDSDNIEFNLKPLSEVDQEHEDASYTHVR